jgi:hypothetical protein
MIDRSEWLAHPGRALFSDPHQAVREFGFALLAKPDETFTNCFGDRVGHAFPSQLGQLACQLMRFVILDIQ